MDVPACSVWILMLLKTIPPPWLSINSAATQNVMILSGHYRRRCRRGRRHPSRRRIAYPRRFSDQMLGNEGIQYQQDDAWNEEEDDERGHVIELGPIFFPLRTARRLALVLVDTVFCQADDWTVQMQTTNTNTEWASDLPQENLFQLSITLTHVPYSL